MLSHTLIFLLRDWRLPPPFCGMLQVLFLSESGESHPWLTRVVRRQPLLNGLSVTYAKPPSLPLTIKTQRNKSRLNLLNCSGSIPSPMVKAYHSRRRRSICRTITAHLLKPRLQGTGLKAVDFGCIMSSPQGAAGWIMDKNTAALPGISGRRQGNLPSVRAWITSSPICCSS